MGNRLTQIATRTGDDGTTGLGDGSRTSKDSLHVAAMGDIDASGEEVVHHLVERFNEAGITLLFSGLKKQVLDVMRATGLREAVGEGRIFSTAEQALDSVYSRAEYGDMNDPLKPWPGDGKVSALPLKN